MPNRIHFARLKLRVLNVEFLFGTFRCKADHTQMISVKMQPTRRSQVPRKLGAENQAVVSTGLEMQRTTRRNPVKKKSIMETRLTV
jgi:hypothetical protein